jgi:hypothetical protein
MHDQYKKLINNDNTAILSLGEFNGYLYAGTRNFETGGEIWRCSDCNEPSDWSLVTTPGFGKEVSGRMETIYGFKDMLYTVVYNGVTGLEVWRTADGSNWEQIGFGGLGDSQNGDIFLENNITEFNNTLLLGTWNYTGAEIWQFLHEAVYLPMIGR